MPQTKAMNIVFSINDCFAPQLAVTISSILMHSNKEDCFNFYVLEDGVSDENKAKIDELKNIKPFKITYLPLDKNDFANYPLAVHLKVVTYFRLRIPSLLNFDRALFLDTDIIVRKSLSELYNTDLGNCYAAVIEDMIFTEPKLGDFLLEKLELKKYFNAGVMLMNLNKMRDDRIEEKCIEFIKTHPEKITYADQCTLNNVLKENVKFLDYKWNFQYNNSSLKQINKLYNKHKSEIAILHFACQYKPWSRNRRHRFSSEWLWYLSKTPFEKSFVFLYIRFMLKPLATHYKNLKSFIRYIKY